MCTDRYREEMEEMEKEEGKILEEVVERDGEEETE
jgi:hypothetical protein